MPACDDLHVPRSRTALLDPILRPAASAKTKRERQEGEPVEEDLHEGVQGQDQELASLIQVIISS